MLLLFIRKGFSSKVSFVQVWIFLILLLPAVKTFAKPVNSSHAEKVVKGWLSVDARPLDMPLGKHIKKVDTFSCPNSEPAYHIVYLEPSGFVIVPADDAVEPIIGFVSHGTYDASADNCLHALVESDVPARVAAARRIEKEFSEKGKNALNEKDEKSHGISLKAADKWNKFEAYADEQRLPMSCSSISDVRVSPFVQSQWSQSYVSGAWCYNYYTPNHYLCGCTATAMAQIMRYYQYPMEGIGINEFTIKVDNISQTAYTRGGDGSGGQYNWDLMPLVPASGINTAQRQAIGALCYDAGVAAHMNYTSSGSGASIRDAQYALLYTFGYDNVIYGSQYDNGNMGVNLDAMVNPNLDAGYPVLLAVRNSSEAHALVCDGYGYNGATLYHHLNMGWAGSQDAWYNLPNIDSSPSFNIVYKCLYNIFTEGWGEIISGRVTDDSGGPISNAEVTAVGTFENIPIATYTATTNNNGIYALVKIFPWTDYNITISKAPFIFTAQVVTTGFSEDWEPNSGNVWEVDFQGTMPGYSSITIGTGTNTWDYPMHTYYHDSRTQVIYLANEIARSGSINALSLYVKTTPGQTMNNWTIRMKHTPMSSYSTASFNAVGWTLVYQANEPKASAGWRKFTFQTPFEYNGIDNLLVDFSHNNASYTTSGYCRYSTPGGIRSAYACSDSVYGDPLNWSGTSSPSVSGSTYVPNIKLTFCGDFKADLDGNYRVDMFDYAILAYQWLQVPGTPSADIAPDNGDGIVNCDDLAVLADEWLQGL